MRPERNVGCRNLQLLYSWNQVMLAYSKWWMIGKWRLHSLSIKPFHVTGLLLQPVLNIRKPWFSMFSSVTSGIKWLRSVFMNIFLTLQKHFGITRLDKTAKSIWIDLKGNAYLITRTTFNTLQVNYTTLHGFLEIFFSAGSHHD